MEQAQQLAGGGTERMTVIQAVNLIRQHKITRQAAFFGLDNNNPQQLQQNWVRPSGQRQPGEGVEDGEQGIIAISIQEEDNIGYKITITLTQLIAGFIIGPNGISVRDLMRRTRCHVKSNTEVPSLGCPRRTRIFQLEGQEVYILKCLDVMLSAIDRYKDLAEGKLQGHYMNRIQKVKGYIFYYYPPPKNVVPNAAGIKGLPPSKRARIKTMGFCSSGSYVAFLESICNQITKNNGTGAELAERIRTVLQLPEEEMDDVGLQYGGLFPDISYDSEMSIQMPNGEELDVNSPTAVEDLMYTIKVQEGMVSADENGQPTASSPATGIQNVAASPELSMGGGVSQAAQQFYQNPQINPAAAAAALKQSSAMLHGQPMYPHHIHHIPPAFSPVTRQVIRDDSGVDELLGEAQKMGQALSKDVALLNKMLDELNGETQNISAQSVGQLLDQQPRMTFDNAMLDMGDLLPSFQAQRLDIAVPLGGRQLAKNAVMGKEGDQSIMATQFPINNNANDFATAVDTTTQGDVLSIQDICKRLASLMESNSYNGNSQQQDMGVSVQQAAAVLASEGFTFAESSTAHDSSTNI